MELQLEQFIKNLEIITDIHNQNSNPVMFRMPKAGTQLGLLFYCSYAVPRYVVLPQNAIWIDLNPESQTYRHAYKRVSKASNPYNDVWSVLYFYEDAMADQEYDPEDLKLINAELPPFATEQVQGIGYLSYPQSQAKVITDRDPTLTNKRPPLPHTHPEKPANRLAINDQDSIPIQDQLAPQISQVLVYENNTLQWRKIKEGELK